MKSENLKNQILVAKNSNFGSKLPLDQRPFLIPEPFLRDLNIATLLKEHGKGYSSETGIEPLYAAEILMRLPDSFQSRRLKDLLIKEKTIRLKACKSPKMIRNVMTVFGAIQDVVIGSYDWSQDEVFVPAKPRLAQVFKIPIKGRSCQLNENILRDQNLEPIS